MKLILTEPLRMLDSSTGKPFDHVEVEPGTYDIDEVPNPSGWLASWYMIRGTSIGSARRSLHQWDFVTITEDDGTGIPMPPYVEHN